MNLYFIRRKSDGFYLRSRETHYSAFSGENKTSWSVAPAYILRTPDGVATNIRKLCSTPRYRENRPWIEWKDFQPEKAELYEVVIQSVTIKGEKVEPATVFLSNFISSTKGQDDE